jgi:DNA-directed RNA polymerase subunit RPC12/RpoP
VSEERSNVHCTNCGREFIATLDLSLNGNHIIECPHCQHEHYRVVKDGVVTEERWGSSSQQVFYAATTTITQTINFTSSNAFTLASWTTRTDIT